MGYKLRTTFLSLLLVLEKFSCGIFLLIIWFSSQGHIAFVLPKGWCSDCSFLPVPLIIHKESRGTEIESCKSISITRKTTYQKDTFYCNSSFQELLTWSLILQLFDLAFPHSFAYMLRVSNFSKSNLNDVTYLGTDTSNPEFSVFKFRDLYKLALLNLSLVCHIYSLMHIICYYCDLTATPHLLCRHSHLLLLMLSSDILQNLTWNLVHNCNMIASFVNITEKFLPYCFGIDSIYNF